MAIERAAGPEQIGRRFAELQGSTDLLEALWVSAQEGAVGLWLVTPPVEMDTVRSLHDLAMTLYDEFPTVELTVEVLNRAWYQGTEFEMLIPAGATRII